MRAVGIIAEYNPFHNGHYYQIRQAKEKAAADLVIVVMSGNFLQRGEPAIVDKWKRAEMALKNGADLVIELPVAFSTQWASDFARGGIQILKDLRVSSISFGSEQGGADNFLYTAKALLENESSIKSLILENQTKNQNYPSLFTEATRKVVGDLPIDLSQSNNMLAIAYIQETIKQNYYPDIFPIQRNTSKHKDQLLKIQSIHASGTAIRRGLFAGQPIGDYVPKTIEAILLSSELVSWENYYALLRYQLVMKTASELNEIYEMEPGLGERFKDLALKEDNYKDFISQAVPKHLTKSKIQRLQIYILLNISKKQMIKEKESVRAIHVLGFTKMGQKYLKSIKNKVSTPIITNLKQKDEKIWRLDILAGNIYKMGYAKDIGPQDFGQHPLIFY